MIERWSAGVADENMAEMILVDLTPIIRRHPWWRARASLTLALLDQMDVKPPSRVIDVGCGWGTTLDAIERRGFDAVGADISRRTLDALDRPDRQLIELDLTRELPEQIDSFDAVLALDVIEHLDDDLSAVARLGELARPGGLVIVSVPALPDLWTEFDAIQGHRRRYLPETLLAAFEGTNLQVERLFWWGRWMVPILRRSRKTPRARPGESASEVYRRYLALPPWPAPLAFRAAFAIEQRPTLAGKLGVGTSLFAVARRIMEK